MTAGGVPDTVKVGMAQILVEGGEREANLQRARAAVAEAAARGAQVVVLPECLDLGWTHPSAEEQAAPVPGPVTDALAAMAAEHGVLVVGGVTERSLSPAGLERRYNAAVLLDEEGRLLLHVRKVNVLGLARDLYEVGDKTGVAETRFGRLGVNICADNFPTNLHLGQTLGWMGARAILSPSAWASDPDQPEVEGNPARGMWLEAYRELAEELGGPVVGVTNVGPISGGVWAGRRCIGCSLAVDRDGAVVAELGTEPEVRVVELALGPHPVKVRIP